MNDDYKKRHKPLHESKTRYHQGYYVPKLHPEKCLTKENIYRSSWEMMFFDWCDRCSAVIRWAAEPLGIKYKNPVKNMEYCKKNGLDPNNPNYWPVCNYYTDVWIELKGKDEKIKKIFIEIKPYSQTQPPKPLKPNATMKEIKRYNREAETYLVNQAKWAAAKIEFTRRGAEFMIVTERTLEKLRLIN